MVDVREIPTRDGLKREIYVNQGELLFVVEGYEKGEPDYMESCYEDEEEGEYFYEQFTNFDEAVEKYLELKEEGWETVRFRIEPKNKKEIQKFGIDFRFYGYREFGKDYCWFGVFLNVERFCKTYAKKLSKIMEIITSGGVEEEEGKKEG